MEAIWLNEDEVEEDVLREYQVRLRQRNLATRREYPTDGNENLPKRIEENNIFTIIFFC